MTRDRRLPDPPPGVSRNSVEPWQNPAIASALAEWQRCVLRLAALDPVTTEVVRLRCATSHDCRFCRTVRLHVDGTRALDEDTAARVARRETEALPPAHAAALRLVDAMISQPAAIDGELVAELRRHFDRAGLVELTLDVMKFSHQKIKVSLGVDTPINDDGALTDFAIATDGRISFGEAR